MNKRFCDLCEKEIDGYVPAKLPAPIEKFEDCQLCHDCVEKLRKILWQEWKKGTNMNRSGTCEICPCYQDQPEWLGNAEGECQASWPLNEFVDRWPKVTKSDWCHEGRMLMERPDLPKLPKDVK